MPPRPGRAGSLLYVTLLYVLAITGAWLVWTHVELHPHWALLCGFAVATAVTFVAAVHADNGSVFDPWWSVFPSFAALWLTGLADSDGLTARQIAVHAVVWFWSIRLTLNWAVGWPGLEHEDWRYVDLKKSWPVPKWVVYLVGVEGLPTLFVWVGCLSLYPALAFDDRSFGMLDGLALFVGLGAVAIELAADEQLRAFAETKQPGDLMDRGLWRLSRHPNYFGEIAFWVSLWLFAVASAPSIWWVIAGPVAMIALFLGGSIPMLDERSLERRPGYAEYARKTPALIPWPRRRGS